jgi:phosphoribosyl 1,2-cyclic phosphodiesterase
MAYIKFWGVRGSIPTPGPSTVRYGGNTPCIELRLSDDKFFILDAGSGLRELGINLLKSGNKLHSHLFISHMHWDHIQGIPFFVPALLPGNEFIFHGAEDPGKSLKDILENQMNPINFPITMEQMASNLNYEAFDVGTYEVEDIKVETMKLNHPGNALGYKFHVNGKTVVYISDNEPKSDEYDIENEKVIKFNDELLNFTKDVNILINDAQYTPEEFKTRVTWGHSPYDFTVHLALTSNVKKLVIFHHDPVHNDEFVDDMILAAKKIADTAEGDLEIVGAKEGLEIALN